MQLEEFLRRLPESANEEREMVKVAFGVTEHFLRKVDDIRANKHLTKVGQDDQIRSTALGAPATQLRQIKQRAANLKAETEKLRLALKPKELDKTDLFAEMQRQEVRTWFAICHTLSASEPYSKAKTASRAPF